LRPILYNSFLFVSNESSQPHLLAGYRLSFTKAELVKPLQSCHTDKFKIDYVSQKKGKCSDSQRTQIKHVQSNCYDAAGHFLKPYPAGLGDPDVLRIALSTRVLATSGGWGGIKLFRTASL